MDEQTTCAKCSFHTQYDDWDCECEILGLSEHYQYCWMSGGDKKCPHFKLDDIFKGVPNTKLIGPREVSNTNPSLLQSVKTYYHEKYERSNKVDEHTK